MSINFDALKELFLAYFLRFRDFDFSYTNPVFWILVVLLFLILLIFWYPGKSFSFCTIISLILLGASKLEKFIVELFIKNGEKFDPLFLRSFVLLIVALVILYYMFMRD